MLGQLSQEDVRQSRSFLQASRTSGEGSVPSCVESTDLASSSPADILSTIGSSLAMRDANSFALASLS